ncbi:glycosyltransferase family 4 protein [Kocuria sp. SL71]|uniref:glycosyltransferase family 4 protein n=1 Tax=Kocuria sp. SL71 TaxID=2995151 RepID=UPI002272BA85|nr:glycosyltransferase family 4 protein [Kocuria sp. SL71]MCY1684619.1 glycosyltransferase family 4 protein [Kocuria sp. SL71]
MTGYLAATSSERTRLEFWESGGAPGPWQCRLQSFFSAASRCLQPHASRVQVFSVASRGSTWRKLILTSLVRLRNSPYVLHLHGGGYTDFLRSQPRPLRWLIRSMFCGAARVIVLGETWAEFVVRDLDVQQERIVVLPNAVPGPSRLPMRAAPVRLVFAGRVGRGKGAPELLEAWSRISAGRDAVLVLAGDLDDPDGSIRAAVDRAERVELTGWLDAEALQDQLRRAQILVLPSRAENLPLSLLEGMAWGLAPVVTPVGAVPEVVDDGENGMLVPVGDPEALSQALATLLDDNARRTRMGDAARVTWENGYSMDGYRERFDDILEAVVGGDAEVEGDER